MCSELPRSPTGIFGARGGPLAADDLASRKLHSHHIDDAASSVGRQRIRRQHVGGQNIGGKNRVYLVKRPEGGFSYVRDL